jgi:type VI secretion system secreted protein Hcp
MLKKLVCLLVATMVLVSSTSAHAAMTAYMRVKGKGGTAITGSVTQKGREGSSQIIASSHEFLSPRDAASGLPTGKRQHKPFTVTMELDKATPFLFKALVNNETLTEVTFQYYRPADRAAMGAGAEVQFYTVKLTNVSIAMIHFNQLNTLNPDLVRYPETVEIQFTYQKITWTWTDGNVSVEDSWLAPT